MPAPLEVGLGLRIGLYMTRALHTQRDPVACSLAQPSSRPARCPRTTLAVSPRAKSQRMCEWLRSTGSFALLRAPVTPCKFFDRKMRFKLNPSRHSSVLNQ